MLKADYIYRGKELKPRLELKIKQLLELKDAKQHALDQLKADTPLVQQKKRFDDYEEFGKDDPRKNLEADIFEIKLQIRKCQTLIIECSRNPRMKFTLDLEESMWLYH